MSKDRNTFAKRQREMEKKRKADQKKERRAKRKDKPDDVSHPAAETVFDAMSETDSSSNGE